MQNDEYSWLYTVDHQKLLLEKEEVIENLKKVALEQAKDIESMKVKAYFAELVIVRYIKSCDPAVKKFIENILREIECEVEVKLTSKQEVTNEKSYNTNHTNN